MTPRLRSVDQSDPIVPLNLRQSGLPSKTSAATGRHSRSQSRARVSAEMPTGVVNEVDPHESPLFIASLASREEEAPCAAAHDLYPVAYTPRSSLCHSAMMTCQLPGPGSWV